MKIAVSLSIGYSTAMHNDILEINDSHSDEEVERIVQEWASNYIDIGWYRVDSDVSKERR